MAETIIVATDGSEHAHKAVKLAGEVAAQRKARVVVVHALLRGHLAESSRRMAEVEHLDEPRNRVEIGLDKAPAQILQVFQDVKHHEDGRQGLENVGRWVLDEAAGELHDLGVGDVKERLEDGDPAKRIVEAAEAEAAGMIFVGTRGLGALGEIFLGSVAHKVMQRASCSVVCVR